MSWESILKAVQGPRRETYMDRGEQYSSNPQGLPVEYYMEKAGKMQVKLSTITDIFENLKNAQKGYAKREPEFYMKRLDEELKGIFDTIKELEDFVERNPRGTSTTFSGYRPR